MCMVEICGEENGLFGNNGIGGYRKVMACWDGVLINHHGMWELYDLLKNLSLMYTAIAEREARLVAVTRAQHHHHQKKHPSKKQKVHREGNIWVVAGL